MTTLRGSRGGFARGRREGRVDLGEIGVGEREAHRRAVGLDVVEPCSLGDRDDVVSAQHPGECHLHRRRARARRQPLVGVPSAAERPPETSSAIVCHAPRYPPTDTGCSGSDQDGLGMDQRTAEANSLRMRWNLGRWRTPSDLSASSLGRRPQRRPASGAERGQPSSSPASAADASAPVIRRRSPAKS